MIRWLIATTLIAVLAVPGVCGSASAATVQVANQTPTFLAAPGEANRVRVEQFTGPKGDLAGTTFEDLGATMTAGSGCRLVDAHHAICDSPSSTVLVKTGDGDDVVLAAPFTSINADGGPGADRLTGSDTADTLSGGGGADVVDALGGNDVLSDGDGVGGAALDADALSGGAGTDTVSYAARPAAVRVDLTLVTQADGDTLTSIENVDGTGGNDEIIGSAGENALNGGPGKDVIFAGAGADRVDGGTGADRIGSEAGADVVRGGQGNDVISLGDGNDLADEKDESTPTGRDDITCGAGIDRVTATQDRHHFDTLARSCERFTAAEATTFAGIVEDDEAITVGLRGVRRSHNTVLVPVTCSRPSGRACVITGQLRPAVRGRLLATPIARVKVKAGGRGTLRLALTRSGRRRVQRGAQLRLLIEDRTKTAGTDIVGRARAQARFFLR